MEEEAMEEGEINDAELKNKFVKPKKRVAGETKPELSSEEELKEQFSTVRSRKNQRNR
jgi:hypothetical protein